MKYLLGVDSKVFKVCLIFACFHTLRFSSASLHRLHADVEEKIALLLHMQLNGTPASILFSSMCSLLKFSGLTYSSNDSLFGNTLCGICCNHVSSYFVRSDQVKQGLNSPGNSLRKMFI